MRMMGSSALLVLAFRLFIFAQSAIATFQSVPELESAMYKPVDGNACVRLLTVSGEIGCGNPGRDKVLAPLFRLGSANDAVDQKSSVLLPFSELSAFLNRTLYEPDLTKKVAGVLVESAFGIIDDISAGSSDDERFPEAPFAPYANRSYVWNPLGSGIINERFNFPVYLLSDSSTATLQEAALGNQKRSFKYPIAVAEFDVVMQTTKVGTLTSDACLVGSSCLPLGGYSVWSALPPVKASSSSNKKLVLAIASMDSASFFRDKTLGADSPLSGLLALLAAVDVLSSIPDSHNWEKQLVIAVFTGEAWGYLGSRQFLNQLANGGSFVQGLNRSLIHQILEVGSVGQAVENAFYAHSQNSEASAATLEVLEALQVAASSINSEDAAEVQVNNASTTNPGLPPSSLMPFIHENENTSGVVLTEFDSVFINKYYHSSLDVKGQVNVSSIAAAASLVARTLYLLVTGQSNISAADSDLLSVNKSLIEELTRCLLTCNPGMACDLVKWFITPTQTCPNHYVGVFLGDPTAPPVAEYIDDTSRFVWNFLANRTASIINDTDTSAIMECTTGCADSEQVCVGSTTEHKGVCVHSTTRYVPAYSTRLQFAASGWRVVPAVSGDVMGNADPVYTESYWKVLGVRVFTTESSTFDAWILIAGMAITTGSFVISLFGKSAFRKRLKHA
ncbi:hypothetical protein GOP47_0001821 [Adiantum capillus-veneris]|uniref:Nicastrin n=1 Tax=Adiantum capillus-veneris TaxID=13818 RepID=A0A9D4V9F5_ADICA|nr:hypothetical protein GOP47_0001821 [Adiantum capillus-veneris]